MNTKDYILLSLGIGTSDDIMDRIIENFNVELIETEIHDIIRDNVSCLGNLGNAIVEYLYRKVITECVNSYGLDRRNFTYWCNMMDSHLYYNNETINDISDIERISKTE